MRNFQSMQVITNLRTISGTLEKYTYFLRNSYKFWFATFFFWLVCLMLTFSTLVLHSTESKLKISMVLRNRPLPSFQHPIVKRILVYRYTQYTLFYYWSGWNFAKVLSVWINSFSRRSAVAVYFPLLLFDSGSSLVSSKNDTPWYHRWI